MKNLIVLDYDNTIAKPKSPPSEKILNIIMKILDKRKIAILTAGRSIKRLNELFIIEIEKRDPTLLNNLLICPKYGNDIYEYENGWYLIYQTKDISEGGSKMVQNAIENLDWDKYTKEVKYKEKIHHKGSVISVNCLGNNATDIEKENWDMDRSIRIQIKEELEKTLKNKYEIFITGRNTIDFVQKGFNKADNLLRLSKFLNLNKKDVVYIGDEFYPEGNDDPITHIGIEVYRINNPSETEVILEKYI